MRKIILLGILALLARPVQALENADAEYLHIEKNYTLDKTGHIRTDYSHEVRLLTYFAVNRALGESFIVTNPEYQTLTVDESVTTMTDGTRVPTPENGFNEVLPRFVHQAPAYAHLREMVVSHTGLERGCTVRFAYHIDTRPGLWPWLMGEEIVGTDHPVRRYTVSVQIPNGTPFHYHLFNSAVEPRVDTEEESTRYTWEFENLDIQYPEPHHAPFELTSPRLVFSTCPDWNTLTAELHRSIDADCGKPFFPEDTAWPLDPVSRVLSIQARMVRATGHVNLDPSLIGYRSLPARRTWNEARGTEMDKAVLLMAMLKSHDPKLALIARTVPFAQNVPTLTQFGKPTVWADAGRSLLLRTDQVQTGLLDVSESGKRVLVVTSKGAEWMELTGRGMDHRIQIRARLTLNPDFILEGRLRLQLEGAFHEPFNGPEDPAAAVRSKLRPILGDVQVRSVIPVSINLQSAVYEMDVSFPAEHRRIDETNRVLFTPVRSAVDAWGLSLGAFNRSETLALPHPMREHVELTLKLPENMKVTGLPDAVDIEGEGHFSQRWEEKDGLSLTRSVTLHNALIPPEQYDLFRKLIQTLTSESARTLVLEIDG